MSVVKQLAGQTVIYGMSNILPRILHFVVFTIYLTYKFEDQYDFGVYLDLYAYATIILVILVYRMDTAFFRFGNKVEEKENAFSTAIIPLFFTVIISAGLMYYYHEELATLIDYQHKSVYIKWFALILGFDALVALPYAKMRLDEKPKKFLFYRLLNIIVTVGVVLFFLEVVPKLDPNSMVRHLYQTDSQIDYVFLANLIASSVVFLFMIPEFFKIKLHFDLVLWKKMFVYSLPLVLVGIAGSINQAFATPIQKYFLGPDILDNTTNAGIYGAAAKMALLLNLFTVAFNYAAEPFFFNNSEKKDSKKAYGLIALAFTIVACFVILGITAYMDVVSLMIGPNYRAALPVVPILLFAYLFLGLYYNFSIWYKLSDKTYWGAIISIIGAIITLVISISYLPSLGFIASAWAALACYAVMTTVVYFVGKRYYPIDYPILKILSYVAITFVIALLLNYIKLFNLHYAVELVLKTVIILFFIGGAWFKDGKRLMA